MNEPFGIIKVCGRNAMTPESPKSGFRGSLRMKSEEFVLCSVVGFSASSFCPLHPDVELEEAWQEDEEGEDYRQYNHTLVAIENVDEISVGTLWHKVDQDVRNGVVDPMENNSGDDGTGAVVHPSKHQADEECVRALWQVEMDDAEEQC